MQSVFFFGACFAFGIVLSVASLIFTILHIPFLSWLILKLLALVSWIFSLGVFVIWLITIVKALSNVEWEIPYIGKLARKQLAGEKLF